MDYISFDSFLDLTPSVPELTERVFIGPNWYVLGTFLELDRRRLKSIEELPRDDVHKTCEMFELFCSTQKATRRKVLDALRKKPISQIQIANEYEGFLKALHESTCKSELYVHLYFQLLYSLHI